MKATVTKREILRVLGHAASVAEKKSTMPMLANVLLTTAAEGKLTIDSTDMYMSLHGSVGAEKTEAGSVAVSARDLFDRVKVLPDGPVHLAVSDGRALSIKAGGSSRKFTLRGADGGDYPPLPRPDESASVYKIPAATFSGLIAKVRASISTDETRAHMNSALFEWDGETVRMVSTDGHRLTKAEAKVAGTAGSITLLIPLKAIGMVSGLCDLAVSEASGDEAAALEFSVSGPSVFFRVAGLVFGAKTVDAAFPPYAQVIPQSSARTVTMGRAALADAVKSVALASSDKTGGVRFSFGGKTLRITSESPDGGDGYDEVPVQTVNGDKAVVGVNSRYIVDTLAVLTADDIEISLSGELDPIVVRPAGEDQSAFLSVIMPMRI